MWARTFHSINVHPHIVKSAIKLGIGWNVIYPPKVQNNKYFPHLLSSIACIVYTLYMSACFLCRGNMHSWMDLHFSSIENIEIKSIYVHGGNSHSHCQVLPGGRCWTNAESYYRVDARSWLWPRRAHKCHAVVATGYSQSLGLCCQLDLQILIAWCSKWNHGLVKHKIIIINAHIHKYVSQLDTW